MIKYFENLISIHDAPSTGDTILNVRKRNFGLIRNGDMVALLNVVAYLRHREQRQNIKFHLDEGAMNGVPYCLKFYKFLSETTDYFSAYPSQKSVDVRCVSLWEYRGALGDHVSIPNARPQQKKIVIFPLTDAPYNRYRNWPDPIFKEIICRYSGPEFSSYEKIMCAAKPPRIDTGAFTLSTDFIQNLHHAMEAEIYIGGDTGMSHFVGALDHGPNPFYYCHGGKGRLNTMPINFGKKGRMVLY